MPQARVAAPGASVCARVIAGAAAGHGVATAIAVSVGDILNKSDLVSEKVIKYTGGALFILFAILTALEIQ